MRTSTSIPRNPTRSNPTPPPAPGLGDGRRHRHGGGLRSGSPGSGTSQCVGRGRGRDDRCAAGTRRFVSRERSAAGRARRGVGGRPGQGRRAARGHGGRRGRQCDRRRRIDDLDAIQAILFIDGRDGHDGELVVAWGCRDGECTRAVDTAQHGAGARADQRQTLKLRREHQIVQRDVECARGSQIDPLRREPPGYGHHQLKMIELELRARAGGLHVHIDQSVAVGRRRRIDQQHDRACRRRKLQRSDGDRLLEDGAVLSHGELCRGQRGGKLEVVGRGLVDAGGQGLRYKGVRE